MTDASPDAIAEALSHVARELVALAEDMRVDGSAAAWLIEEFGRTVDRLPPGFDRQHAKTTGAAILRDVGVRNKASFRRDLFLIYLPEDRLPVAAPLAIELTKRRFTVAFAGYEVDTVDELARAVNRGLAEHNRGALLWTRAFEHRQWSMTLPEDSRLRIERTSEIEVLVATLTAWIGTNRLGM